MIALGLTDSQIGLVASIGLAFQIVMAWLGGAITDKLGRRLCNFIFDLISWSLPCLIWAASQNIYWFIIAAILNSTWRISMTAWPLLLAEDTDPKLLVDIYSWVYIFSVSVALFTPIAGLMIDKMTLIPAMRLLFIISAVLMTVKMNLLFAFSHETTQGKIRKEQTRKQSIFSLLSGYRVVFAQMLKTPETMYTLIIVVINTICNMISNTFWSILVTQKIAISPQLMSVYPFARAIFVLIFFFSVSPIIRKIPFRIPMLAAYMGFVISQLILVLLPVHNYALLLLSVFLEAFSYACLNPQIDRLMVVTLEPQERARIVSIVGMAALIISTPFGWIAGQLSEINRIYPFILNLLLFAVGGFLTYRSTKKIPALGS